MSFDKEDYNETAPWEKFDRLISSSILEEKYNRKFIPKKKYFYEYIQGTMPEFTEICKRNTVSMYIDELLRTFGMYFNLSNPFLGLIGLISILISSRWSFICAIIAAITGIIITKLYNCSNNYSGVNTYNQVFIGLVISYLYQYQDISDIKYLIIVIILSILTHFTFSALSIIFVKNYKISLQLYPSIIILFIWMLAVQDIDTFKINYTANQISNDTINIEDYLNSIKNGIGAYYLSDNNIYSVILIVLGWLVTSPLMGLYMIYGLLVGSGLTIILGVKKTTYILGLHTLNCITPSMNIGGMYFVPALFNLVNITIGISLSIILTSACIKYMDILGIISLTFSSMIVNSIFQISIWESKNLIPINLNNITTCEDHIRRSRLRNSIITKFSEIKFIIENSEIINNMDAIEQGLLPILLCHYSKNNNYIKLEELLQLGANPDLSDYDGRTALHIACSYNSVEIYNILKKYNAKTNILDRYGHNASMSAFLNKNYHLIQDMQIIAQPGELGYLLCKLCSENKIEELKYILNEENVNYYDYDIRTPLHLAVEKENNDIVELLLSKGASINIKDNFGNTPANLANTKNYLKSFFITNKDKNIKETDTINMIQTYDYTFLNININQELYTLLSTKLINEKDNKIFQPFLLCGLASINDLENIRKLHSYGIELIQYDYDRRNALHIAAANGNVIVLNYLIHYANQWDISEIDNWGNSPLYEACINNHENCVNSLLASNAKINMNNEKTINILGWAIISKKFGILRLLYKSGANFDAKDYDNRSIYDIASLNNIDLNNILS
jgi:ankyrin repeat protein/urea transporter